MKNGSPISVSLLDNDPRGPRTIHSSGDQLRVGGSATVVTDSASTSSFDLKNRTSRRRWNRTPLASAVTLDEHLLTDPRKDRDFNGGGEISLSGTPATHAGFLVAAALALIDRAWGFASPGIALAVP